ncbi:MAG: hypothetical protein ACRDRH_10450 [Pseudonocardia sp.]
MVVVEEGPADGISFGYTTATLDHGASLSHSRDGTIIGSMCGEIVIAAMLS